MLKIGLTGSIGSGKSTVAKFFAELGITVIDADVIVHELLANDMEIRQQVLAHFGPDAALPNGEINRQYLRSRIFADADERHWLEQLLHPRVCVIMLERAQQAKSPYCILVIPLLFEAKLFSMVDRILVVECPEDTRLNRLLARDQSSKEQLRQIMQSQVDDATRRARADDVIVNDGALPKLKQQVLDLHQKYLLLTTTA